MCTSRRWVSSSVLVAKVSWLFPQRGWIVLDGLLTPTVYSGKLELLHGCSLSVATARF